MGMSASAAFRRTLLTSASRLSRPATNNTFSSFTRTAAPITRSSQASFSKAPARHFSATMADKEGVHNLTSRADFDTAMATKDTLMVLDCFATWCGPCKVIAPQVVKMSDTYKDARFYKIDVDDVPEVAQELGVRAMPTFFLFKNGEKVSEVVGANPKALETAIQNNV